MRRTFATVGTVVALSFAMAGCQGVKIDGPIATTTTSDTPTTITDDPTSDQPTSDQPTSDQPTSDQPTSAAPGTIPPEWKGIPVATPGQKFTFKTYKGDGTIQFDKAVRIAGDSYAKPSNGGYLGLYVTFIADKGSDLAVNGLYFTAVGTNGEQKEKDYSPTCEPRLSAGDALKGQKKSGCTVFDVPKGPVKITYAVLGQNPISFIVNS